MIKERNKIIASFMGEMVVDDCISKKIKGKSVLYGIFYHSDWNTIMPVIKRIREIVNDGRIIGNTEAKLWCNIMDAIVDVNIAAAHENVFKYIYWHNQRNNL